MHGAGVFSRPEFLLFFSAAGHSFRERLAPARLLPLPALLLVQQQQHVLQERQRSQVGLSLFWFSPSVAASFLRSSYSWCRTECVLVCCLFLFCPSSDRAQQHAVDADGQPAPVMPSAFVEANPVGLPIGLRVRGLRKVRAVQFCSFHSAFSDIRKRFVVFAGVSRQPRHAGCGGAHARSVASFRLHGLNMCSVVSVCRLWTI